MVNNDGKKQTNLFTYRRKLTEIIDLEHSLVKHRKNK